MIPPLAHLVWLGGTLPWLTVLAVRSAALRGGFERVVLHHDSDLTGTPWWPELVGTPGVEARPLDAPAVLERAGVDVEAFLALLPRLAGAASRVNVLRAALLAADGGVYLDTDTVTIASLAPLRAEAGVFCGAERVAWPGTVRRGGSPAAKAVALARDGVRAVCALAPGGWRAFRRIEGAYPTAVNNAVLGAAPRHPFVLDLLERMRTMPDAARLRRFALGTHLLQARVAAYAGGDLHVHPPPVFYPLGPEVSAHWFRRTPGAEGALAEVLAPSTRVVHWYASVHTRRHVPTFDPGHVRARAHDQLLSALARPFVDDAA